MMVNTFFEERVEQLFELLERARAVFERAAVDYRLVGGLAVYLHVSKVDEDAGRLTKDVDIAINRSDLDRIVAAAREFGFEFRHVAGVDMLVDAAKPSARRAIHLLFAGEKVKTDAVAVTPPIQGAGATLKGAKVASIEELITMKLTSFRDKDRTHVRDLDEVGLITPEVEASLLPVLRERLAHIRATE
jgi:hypothetical protein